MAWVCFHAPEGTRNLATLYEKLSAAPGERQKFARRVKNMERFAGGLTHIAVEREARVGEEGGGSNFMTVANQLTFLNYPELLAHTATSSLDPLVLVDGRTDFFVVVPGETVEHVKGWLRLWVAIPNAVAGIEPLKKGMLIVTDEMPRIGILKPVMDGYTMAAGKGVYFWCFAQSISALDSTRGKEHRKPRKNTCEVRHADRVGHGVGILPSDRKCHFLCGRFRGDRIWGMDAGDISIVCASPGFWKDNAVPAIFPSM